MTLEKVFIDDGCLVIRFDSGFEYDPDLIQTMEPWWLGHMREKNWFTQDVENQALKVLGKTENDWPETRKRRS